MTGATGVTEIVERSRNFFPVRWKRLHDPVVGRRTASGHIHFRSGRAEPKEEDLT
jgi:hypothetical protein